MRALSLWMVAAIALVFGMAIIHTAPARATEVEARGMSRDGSDYRVMCPANSYIVGLRVRAGAWIDQMWIICADWDANARKLGAPKVVDISVGASSGGGDLQSADCAGYDAVKEIAMRYLQSDNHYVDNFAVSCMGLLPPHERGFYKSVDSHDEPVSNPPPAAVTTCPDGELATGVHGLADEFIYSIGLTCMPQPGAAPAPQAPLGQRIRQGVQQGGGVGGNPNAARVRRP